MIIDERVLVRFIRYMIRMVVSDIIYDAEISERKYQINLVFVFAVDLPYATVIPPVTFLGLTLDTPETPKTPNPTPLNMFPGQIQILYCHARQCAENFFLYGFYSKENLLWTNFDNLFRIDQIFPPSTPFSFLFIIFQPP